MTAVRIRSASEIFSMFWGGVRGDQEAITDLIAYAFDLDEMGYCDRSHSLERAEYWARRGLDPAIPQSQRRLVGVLLILAQDATNAGDTKLAAGYVAEILTRMELLAADGFDGSDAELEEIASAAARLGIPVLSRAYTDDRAGWRAPPRPIIEQRLGA